MNNHHKGSWVDSGGTRLLKGRVVLLVSAGYYAGLGFDKLSQGTELFLQETVDHYHFGDLIIWNVFILHRDEGFVLFQERGNLFMNRLEGFSCAILG